MFDLEKLQNVYLFRDSSLFGSSSSHLSAVISCRYKIKTLPSSAFVFVRAGRMELKILIFALNGLLVIRQKSLKFRFPWPKDGVVKVITVMQFKLLLNGIRYTDFSTVFSLQ